MIAFNMLHHSASVELGFCWLYGRLLLDCTTLLILLLRFVLDHRVKLEPEDLINERVDRCKLVVLNCVADSLLLRAKFCKLLYRVEEVYHLLYCLTWKELGYAHKVALVYEELLQKET